MPIDEKKKQEIEGKLHLLLDLFMAKLPQKIADIADAWQSCANNPENRESWTTLHRLLHTLAGSSGSFGFTELGIQARFIENEVKALMASGETNLASARTQLGEHLRNFMQDALKAYK